MTTLTSQEIVKPRIGFRDPPWIGWHFGVMPAKGQVCPVTNFGFARCAPDPRANPYPHLFGVFSAKETSIPRPLSPALGRGQGGGRCGKS